MNSVVRCGTVAVAVALGAFACSDSASPPGEPGANVPVVRLRQEPYPFAFYSGLDKPDRIVVRDAVNWQIVWKDVWRGFSEVPPLPTVDFSREMILVAALGARSTGGYGIMIDAANEADNGGINVTVRSTSPLNCLVTEAFTQPVDIARLPMRGRVEFTERSEVHQCQ
jgi:protease stability complex PrcB-like protein